MQPFPCEPLASHRGRDVGHCGRVSDRNFEYDFEHNFFTIVILFLKERMMSGVSLLFEKKIHTVKVWGVLHYVFRRIVTCGYSHSVKGLLVQKGFISIYYMLIQKTSIDRENLSLYIQDRRILNIELRVQDRLLCAPYLFQLAQVLELHSSLGELNM